MHEVTIPLRHFRENEAVPEPEEILKVVQDTYAAKYLANLGVAATPANKAAVIRERPLDNCEVHGIWAEEGRLKANPSARAEAVKIVQHRRQRWGSGGEVTFDHKAHPWYGQAAPIDVRIPTVSGLLGSGTSGHDQEAAGGDAQHAGAAAAAAAAAPVETTKTLAEELERIRQGAPRTGAARVGGSARGGGGGCRNGADPEAAELENERRERQMQELESLKAKFILPFACERPLKEGSQRMELYPWPEEGVLDLEVPPALKEEAMQPIRQGMEEVQRSTTKWITECLPLELLTSKTEPATLSSVRSHLLMSEVFHLIGLLGHLLYWLVLGVNRPPGEKSLTETALSALFGHAHKLWSALERDLRGTALGVSLVLPTLMLTVKRGVERCFEVQYPHLLAVAKIKQQLVDRINTLMMRLFDPDGTYSRFGKFDGTRRAIALTKRLEGLSLAHNEKAKKLHDRAKRSTPLVEVLMRGTPPSGAIAKPPQDAPGQTALLKAAMVRLQLLPGREDGEASRRGGPGGQPLRRSSTGGPSRNNSATDSSRANSQLPPLSQRSASASSATQSEGGSNPTASSRSKRLPASAR